MNILDEEPPGKSTQKMPTSNGSNQNATLPLLHYIPQTKENHFFYSNGLSKLIPRLTVKVHSDLDECETLWNIFSPKQSLFDLWDYRMAWYEGYGYKPFFYTVYEQNKPLAVLPLCYNSIKGQYQWFGSDWMEDNTFFVTNEKLIDVLYEIAPGNMHINGLLSQPSWEGKKFQPLLKLDDAKNIKSIEGMDSMDDLLATFHKKDRYNLKRDFQMIDELNPKVVITEGKNMEKMSKMIEMNIERFSKNPDDLSDLIDKERRVAYEQMMNNSGKYGVRFIEVYIQNRLAAIDFILTYNGIYYTMKGGNDLDRFDGIGNFMVYTEFEDAIKNGFKEVNCLQMDNGWKHRFFDQKDVYILEK